MNVVILGLNRDQVRRVEERTQQLLTYEEKCVRALTRKALLSLHEILVSYALSVILPQAQFFRFPTRPVVWQL